MCAITFNEHLLLKAAAKVITNFYPASLFYKKFEYFLFIF